MERSRSNDRVRLNALQCTLLSWWVAAVWALARSPQANILTRSRTAVSLRHTYEPTRSPEVDFFTSAVFEWYFFDLNQTACIPVFVQFLLVRIFKFKTFLGALVSHSTRRPRIRCLEALRSVHYRLKPIDQSDVENKYCVLYLGQSRQSLYNKAGVWAHVAAILLRPPSCVLCSPAEKNSEFMHGGVHV